MLQVVRKASLGKRSSTILFLLCRKRSLCSISGAGQLEDFPHHFLAGSLCKLPKRRLLIALVDSFSSKVQKIINVLLVDPCDNFVTSPLCNSGSERD